MAEAPAQSSEFDIALAELMAELNAAGVRPEDLRRATLVPRTSLPERSEGQRAAEAMGLPAGAAPAVDRLLQLEPYLREFTGVPQIGRASDAIAETLADPSIPNATNAAVQTALGALRPMAAVKALGAGLVAGLAKDAGGAILPSAEAQSPLNRQQRREMEMERQRAERQAEIDRRAGDAAAARERANADAEAERQRRNSEAAEVLRSRTEASAAQRAEYDRAVARAEQMAAKERERDIRFSDTAVGQTWNKLGGLGSMLFGFGGAAAARGAGRQLPAQLFSGTLSGALSSGLPLSDAIIAPPYNPKRAEYERLAEELPPTHPRRAEYEARVADKERYPEANPIRKAATDEVRDLGRLATRVGLGAAEGLGGALFGSDLTEAAAKLALAKARANRQSPAIGPGVGVDDTLPVNALSKPPTAGPASFFDTVPASVPQNGLAGPSPSQRPLPALEALPSPLASQKPQVVIQTKDSRGVVQHRKPKGEKDGGRYTSDPRKPDAE